MAQEIENQTLNEIRTNSGSKERMAKSNRRLKILCVGGKEIDTSCVCVCV